MTEDDLLAAAFGSRPDLPITAIPPDPWSRWLAAVALGAQGRYAAATTLLNPLTTTRTLSAAAALVTVASHRRQLGGHHTARTLDATALHHLAALAHPPTPPHPPVSAAETTADALLGLSADALGLGRVGEARRLLAAAGRLGEVGWRGAIRSRWVSAEIELGAGQADRAVPFAEAAGERAAAGPSVRHRVKSGMVLGAALAGRGRRADHVRAKRILRDTVGDATELNLLPLVWPCALLLAELEPAKAGAHRRQAGDALRRVLSRTDSAGRRIAACSPWVPEPCPLTG